MQESSVTSLTSNSDGDRTLAAVEELDGTTELDLFDEVVVGGAVTTNWPPLLQVLVGQEKSPRPIAVPR